MKLNGATTSVWPNANVDVLNDMDDLAVRSCWNRPVRDGFSVPVPLLRTAELFAPDIGATWLLAEHEGRLLAASPSLRQEDGWYMWRRRPRPQSDAEPRAVPGGCVGRDRGCRV
jgi:hypothetical protein